VPAPLLEPEVFVEAPAQFGGLPAVAVAGGPVAELGGEMGPFDVGGVDVALHLAEGDGGLGVAAVGEADAVPRVLPALVGQPVRRAALVLDVAVAVAVTELFDPCEGAVGVREESPERVVVEPPAPGLAEAHAEQRGGAA